MKIGSAEVQCTARNQQLPQRKAKLGSYLAHRGRDQLSWSAPPTGRRLIHPPICLIIFYPLSTQHALSNSPLKKLSQFTTTCSNGVASPAPNPSLPSSSLCRKTLASRSLTLAATCFNLLRHILTFHTASKKLISYPLLDNLIFEQIYYSLL